MWGRDIREFGIDMYTLLYFKWITNMDPLYSTGNCAQCYVTAWMGKELGGERVHGYIWLSPFAVRLKLFSSVQFSCSVVPDSLRPPRTVLLKDGLVGSPCSPRDSQESSPTPQFTSISFSVLSLLYSPTLTSIHDHWTRRTFVGKVMSLLLNMLCRLVITFLPRSKRLLISWLPSPSAVILELPKIRADTVSTVSPSISH